MSKRFALWRLPPVLVVQLKRFQFDRTSRRKLTNKVDFPLDGLDLSKYLAPTRWDHLKSSLSNNEKENKENKESKVERGNNSENNDGNQMKRNLSKMENNENDGTDDINKTRTYNTDDTDTVKVNEIQREKIKENNKSNNEKIAMTMNGKDGSLYDLYSVVHHIGALGGGHYVTTTRDREKGIKSENARKLAREMSRSNLSSISKNLSSSSSSSSSLFSSTIPSYGNNNNDNNNSNNNNSNDNNNDDNNIDNNNNKDKIISSNSNDDNIDDKVDENNNRKSSQQNIQTKDDGKGIKTEEIYQNMTEKNSGTENFSVAPPPGGQWWCYNDDVVTEVKDPREVTSSSAYVLFYMRRDVWGMPVQDIFDECRRTSMGDMVNSTYNTGTLTGTTSRMHEYTGRTDNSDTKLNGKITSTSTSFSSLSQVEGSRGFWRTKLPAVVSRNSTNINSNNSPNPGGLSSNNNSSGIKPNNGNHGNTGKITNNSHIAANTNSIPRTLAPIQNQNQNRTDGQQQQPTLHSTLSNRLSLRSLAQSHHPNFSGDAGGEESSDDDSGNENGGGRGRGREKGGGQGGQDADKCIIV